MITISTNAPKPKTVNFTFAGVILLFIIIIVMASSKKTSPIIIGILVILIVLTVLVYSKQFLQVFFTGG